MNPQALNKKLHQRLALVESRRCECGYNLCARCDESHFLRDLLGLPAEQDQSLKAEQQLQPVS